MHEYLIPLLLCLLSVFVLWKKENAYETLVSGASEGLKLLTNIAPALIILLSSIEMLRVSGAAEFLADQLSPLLSKLGIPPETIILILIRPLSGSAALAVGADLIIHHGPDSTVGRTAAVMLGSTETTFYTLSVYFGACGIKKTRYALPAALIADMTGFLSASWTVKLFMT